MVAMIHKNDIEPRLSVLEKGQENLQNNLMSLANSVKEQGTQLESALIRLSEKMDNVGKTDWTTFWTMVGTLVLLLGAISTPVWLHFNAVEKEFISIKDNIKDLNTFQLNSVSEHSKLKTKIEIYEKHFKIKDE